MTVLVHFAFVGINIPARFDPRLERCGHSHPAYRSKVGGFGCQSQGVETQRGGFHGSVAVFSWYVFV